MKKLSVIIPVYNGETYLSECLKSVSHQTMRDLEIICVDDGSTDQTPELLKSFAAEDDRLRILSKSNSGYGNSMNVGMNAADGEYIGIVEADDWVKPRFFEELIKTADEQQAEIVKSDLYIFRDEAAGRVITEIPICNDKTCYGSIINTDINFGVMNSRTNIWTGVYRRDFLQKRQIRFNETPGAAFQDNGFWFQTTCLAERMFFLSEAYYMCRRDNPKSSIYDPKKMYYMTNEYRFIRQFLEKDPRLLEKYVGVFQVRKFDSFIFTFVSIPDELQKTYAHHMRDEFSAADQAGELDRALFLPEKWEELQSLLRDADEFYWRRKIGDEHLKRQIAQLKDERDGILNSPTYRIGSAVTWLPRKVRNLVTKR